MSDEPIAKIQVVLTDTKKKPNLFDPFFKYVTKKIAVSLGIKPSESSIQHNTLADTVLLVPPDVSLAETLFDFFWRVNVVEFKSIADDPLSMREFIKNQTRTNVLYLDEPESDYRDFLTVYVVARNPQEFLKEARAEGLRFKAVKDKPWLLEAKCGVQPVLLVVCRKMPLEEPYLYWLAFASMDKAKWFNYMLTVVRHKDPELIRLIRRLRRKEYDAIMSNIAFIEQLQKEGLLTLEEKEYLVNERIDDFEDEFLDIVKNNRYKLRKIVENMSPEGRIALVEEIPSEELLQVLKPEERLQGLEPSEIVKALTPEQRQKLFNEMQKEQF